MKTKYTNKEIWIISYPILISLVMEQMIGMTDTAFLGRVGEIELGASAIAGIYYMVIFMMAFGFSIGAQIMIARRNGERQYNEIGPIFLSRDIFPAGTGRGYVCTVDVLLANYIEKYRLFTQHL